ncbi:hypothetical protein ACU4GD_10145 [Cupriavidus basilensis]
MVVINTGLVAPAASEQRRAIASVTAAPVRLVLDLNLYPGLLLRQPGLCRSGRQRAGRHHRRRPARRTRLCATTSTACAATGCATPNRRRRATC